MSIENKPISGLKRTLHWFELYCFSVVSVCGWWWEMLFGRVLLLRNSKELAKTILRFYLIYVNLTSIGLVGLQVITLEWLSSSSIACCILKYKYGKVAIHVLFWLKCTTVNGMPLLLLLIFFYNFYGFYFFYNSIVTNVGRQFEP